MGEHALAAGVVIVAWWSSTAAVMRLAWLDRSSHRVGLLLLGALALAALYGVHWTSGRPTVGAAYLGFGCALAIWAWHELAFLIGAVAGPRTAACPPDAIGWRRFRLATATVIHHEVALAATLVVLLAVTWGAPNQVAFWTFGVLWVLRLSAKLNLFFGVRSFSTELVPARLRYLTSYFRRRRYSPLLTLTLVAGAAAAAALAAGAAGAAPGFASVGRSLLLTLLLLGLLEHVFLAVPLREARLWSWLLEGRKDDA